MVEAMGASLPPGSLGFQLRDQERPWESLRGFALQLRDVTRRMGVFYILNGPPVWAWEVQADGVHLGRRVATVTEARRTMGPNGWVSVPAHADAEVTEARTEGASAVLVSPIFAVPGKGQPRGMGALEEAARRGRGALDVYALGGIHGQTAGECRRAGAYGVVVTRAVWDASDPVQACRGLLSFIE